MGKTLHYAKLLIIRGNALIYMYIITHIPIYKWCCNIVFNYYNNIMTDIEELKQAYEKVLIDYKEDLIKFWLYTDKEISDKLENARVFIDIMVRINDKRN